MRKHLLAVTHHVSGFVSESVIASFSYRISELCELVFCFLWQIKSRAKLISIAESQID